MQHINHPIVVGVDGSPCSIAALQKAGQLATDLNTILRAVTSWETPQLYTGDITFHDEDFSQDAHETLNHALQQAFGNNPPVPIDQVVRKGRPGSVLVEESQDAYLLVIGARGNNEFVSMLLGSASLECVVHAHAPVVTVRADSNTP